MGLLNFYNRLREIQAAGELPPSITLKPTMTNFRVEDGDLDKVKFSTPNGSVTGIDYTKFTISGKNITGVTIENDSSGYFTVDSDFNYFQRGRTIKQVSGNGTVYDFTMQHIDNRLTQSTHLRERFVSVSGGGTHDGTSEANAWTFAESQSGFLAGDLIHTKAGNYGNGEYVFPRGGNSINFVEYRVYRDNS